MDAGIQKRTAERNFLIAAQLIFFKLTNNLINYCQKKDKSGKSCFICIKISKNNKTSSQINLSPGVSTIKMHVLRWYACSPGPNIFILAVEHVV